MLRNVAKAGDAEAAAGLLEIAPAGTPERQALLAAKSNFGRQSDAPPNPRGGSREINQLPPARKGGNAGS